MHFSSDRAENGLQSGEDPERSPIRWCVNTKQSAFLDFTAAAGTWASASRCRAVRPEGGHESQPTFVVHGGLWRQPHTLVGPLEASVETSRPVQTFQLTVSVNAVLPVGGLQQRRLSAHRVSDPQSAAQNPLSVLEDGQGANGHPDQRAPPHLGAGLQPSADRWVPVQSLC